MEFQSVQQVANGSPARLERIAARARRRRRQSPHRPTRMAPGLRGRRLFHSDGLASIRRAGSHDLSDMHRVRAPRCRQATGQAARNPARRARRGFRAARVFRIREQRRPLGRGQHRSLHPDMAMDPSSRQRRGFRAQYHRTDLAQRCNAGRHGGARQNLPLHRTHERNCGIRQMGQRPMLRRLERGEILKRPARATPRSAARHRRSGRLLRDCPSWSGPGGRARRTDCLSIVRSS